MTERLSATRTIPATAAQIFAVLTDPDGHVAVDSSGMLQRVTGRQVTAVGDTFTAHMDRESLGDYPMGTYDVEVQITALTSPTAIAWTIDGELKPAIGHVYGYELEEIGPESTRVTSYCDWSQAHPKWKPIFPVIDDKALRASLGLLERAVGRGYPRPAGASPAAQSHDAP